MAPRGLVIVLASALVIGCGTLTPSEGGVVDGGTSDGPAVGTDGGPTNPNPPPPPGTFCSDVHATFCRDFDDGRTFTADWSGSYFNAGTLPVLDGLARSAPNSVLITLPASLLSADTSYAYLENQIGTTLRPFAIAFDVNLTPPAWKVNDANVAIASVILVEDGTKVGSLILYVSETNLSVATELSIGVAVNASAPLPVGTWSRLRARLDPPGTTSGWSLVLTMDGVTILDTTIQSTGTPITALTTLRLQIGLSQYNHPTPAFEARYDNVVFELF